MFDDVYDNYIRNLYGLNENNYYSNYNRGMDQKEEIEEYYPEIYKIVYPMISKACSSRYEPINKSLVENLTNEIYLALEANTEFNEKLKEINETRSPVNRGLQDLIKILILRELLGRPGWRPRPPMPPPPPRPPYPGPRPFPFR